MSGWKGRARRPAGHRHSVPERDALAGRLEIDIALAVDGKLAHIDAEPYRTVLLGAISTRVGGGILEAARGEQPVGDWSERQGEVLDAALSLLVSSGSGLTMAAVARRANCSKETLYKWFGGRDGLLTATVQRQASKVRAVPDGEGELDRAALEEHLTRFASDWLSVISGSTSIALNRLAVGQAGSDKRDLGAVVLENGPVAMGMRLMPLLDRARSAGLVDFADAETAFRSFFGLVVRDLQIRLLLGERPGPRPDEIAEQARRASRQFLALYGAVTSGRREPAGHSMGLDGSGPAYATERT